MKQRPPRYMTTKRELLDAGRSKLNISAPPTRRLSNSSATTLSPMDVYHCSKLNCEVTIVDPLPSRADRTIRSKFAVSTLIGVVGKSSRASSSVVIWLINYRRFESLGPSCVLCFTKLTSALQDRYPAASKYSSLTAFSSVVPGRPEGGVIPLSPQSKAASLHAAPRLLYTETRTN